MNKSQKNYILILRSSSPPSFSAPFYARSVGMHYAESNFCSRRKPGAPYLELMWTIDGEGMVSDEGKEYPVTSGMVFLLLPGRFRFYYTRGDYWFYRWLTMDGPDIISIFNTFRVSHLPRLVGPCPETDFMDLMFYLSQPTELYERLATATAFRILLQATGNSLLKRGDNLSQKMKQACQLISQYLHSPTLSVQWIAEQIQIHRSYFTKNFSQSFHCSPIEYIHRLRFQRATHLLLQTSLSIKEIAEQCGFQDPDYFTRWFTSRWGQSPKRFRSEHFGDLAAKNSITNSKLSEENQSNGISTFYE